MQQLISLDWQVFMHLIFLQQPLILKNKGIKIGFLGYCDIPRCVTVRKKYKAGPAVYSDLIAQRDVRQLKVRKFLGNKQMWACFMIGLLKRKRSTFTIRYFTIGVRFISDILFFTLFFKANVKKCFNKITKTQTLFKMTPVIAIFYVLRILTHLKMFKFEFTPFNAIHDMIITFKFDTFRFHY